MISKRSMAVDSSGIRKVFNLAAKMKNPINLSIGQPDFDVPDECKEKAIQSIKQGKNKYTLTQGIPELREEIKDYLKKRNADVEDVFITSGVSGGILLSLLALTDPGDEIIITDPYFVIYKHLARLLNLNIKFIDIYPDFKLTAERVEKAVSRNTKVIFINSPSNPTGTVVESDEMEKIAEILRKYGVFAVFDEIYSEFDYEGKHDVFSKYYENTILLNGFSKSHAMTGWRLGYAAGPSTVINEMIKLQQYTFVCAPSMAQYGAIGAASNFSEKVFNDYKKKRDLVFNMLNEYFEVVKPEGAFYIFPKSPIEGNSTEFVKKAIEKGVLIIPGNVFSEKDTHFRISFANKDEILRKGCEILIEIAGNS